MGNGLHRSIGAKDVRAALSGRLQPRPGLRSPRAPDEHWLPGFTEDIHRFVDGSDPVAGGRIRYLLDGLLEADLRSQRRRLPLLRVASPPPPRLRLVDHFETLPESAAVLATGRRQGVSATRVRRRLTALAWAFNVTGRRRPATWSADLAVGLFRRYARERADGAVMLAEAVRDLWCSRGKHPFGRAQSRRYAAYLLLSHMDWFDLGPKDIPASTIRRLGISPGAGPR